MARVIRSEQAQRDLEEIFEHLDGQGADLADRFATKLDELCELHSTQPSIGASADEYAPDLRYFLVWKYVIFYRSLPDGIQIIRMIHGARDLPRFFP